MKTIALLCALLCVSIAAASSVHAHIQGVKASNLEIVVLTESLCPDCQAFLTSSFKDAIEADGIEGLANITIVPFGNARESKSGDHWAFTCQHAENECLGNAVQNCLQAHQTKAVSHRVLVCLEEEIPRDRNWTRTVQTCAQQEGVDLSNLLTCATSEEGNTLSHNAAQNTPDHEYVPWVIVNGKHDTDAESQILDNLVNYVCSKTGSQSTPACRNHELRSRKSHVINKSLNVAQDDRVQVTVLTESLCPYCQQFITGSFSQAFNVTDIDKIANITIVPFGNAKETQTDSGYTYTCQHGERECVGNIVQNCLLSHVEKKKAQQVLICLEKQVFTVTDWTENVNQCAQSENIDLSAVLTCANSEEGKTLIHQAATNTDPQHQYVPWVIVNGQHDENLENLVVNNLLKYICDNYKGSVKIDACKTNLAYNHRLPRSYKQ